MTVVIYVILLGFSTFKNYCKQYDILESQQNSNFDPTIDEEFCYMFEQNLRNNIIRPVQMIYPIIDRSKFIFCMDCARKNIWRREFYPEYKLNRDLKDKTKDKFNVERVFKYAYNIILPNFCEEYGAHKLLCQCAEGDDIIAVLTKYFLEQNIDDKIIIISCDKDMVQLSSDRVTIITADGMIRNPKLELESKLKKTINQDITASDFLLFKILIGDTADNIPNVKPGIGPKKAFKYIQDRTLLKSLLTEDITIADSFLRNKKLISMNEIPIDIHKLIISELENSIKLTKNKLNL